MAEATAAHAVVACPGPFNYARDREPRRRARRRRLRRHAQQRHDDRDARLARAARRAVLARLGSARSGSSSSTPTVAPARRGRDHPHARAPLARRQLRTVDRWLTSTRNAAAVTGACQIVRTEAWRAARRARRAAGGRLQRRGLLPAAERGGLARRLHPRGRARPPRERLEGQPAPDGRRADRSSRAGTCSATYVDPSMPPAIRSRGRDRAGRRAGGGRRLDDARGPATRLPRGHEDAAALTASSRPSADPAARDRGAPAAARPASCSTRRASDALRASRPPAPPGAAPRRSCGRERAARHGAARRREPPRARRYRQYYAHARPGPSQLRSRAAAARSTSRPPRRSRSSSPPGTATSRRPSRRSDAQVYDRIEVVVVATRELDRAPPSSWSSPSGTFEELANAGVAAANGEFVLRLRCGRRASPPTRSVDLVAAVQDGADAAYGDEDRYDVDAASTPTGTSSPPRSATRPSSPTTSSARRSLVRTELSWSSGASTSDRAGRGPRPRAAPRRAHRVDRPRRRACCSADPRLDAPDPADATAATVAVVARRSRGSGRPRSRRRGRGAPVGALHLAPPSPAPSVAIVIPTRDRLDLLEACIDVGRARAAPIPNYSIMICDNDSVEERTLAWMRD